MTNSLDIPQVADNQNNKETTINQATAKLGDAMTAQLAVDLTSGNHTLSATEEKSYFVYNCTGHTIARTLTVLAIQRTFEVINGGTGTLTVAVGSGSTTIPPGATSYIYTDGTANGIQKLAENGFDINAYIAGTPTVSVSAFTKVAARPYKLPVSLAGSSAYADTAPSGGSVDFDLQQNAVSKGTMSFASGSHTATFTFTAAISFVAGDRLSFIAPSNLRSMANIAVSLATTFN